MNISIQKLIIVTIVLVCSILFVLPLCDKLFRFLTTIMNNVSMNWLQRNMKWREKW